MFTFTANFADGDQEIKLPEKWSEVIFEQYCDLVLKDDKNWFTRLHVFTGIEVEDLKSLPLNIVELLIQVIGFMADMTEIQNANKVPVEYEGFNYANIPYVQHEKVMAEIKRVKDQGLTALHAAPVLVEACTKKVLFTDGENKNLSLGVNIRQRPITEVLGLANFFLAHSMLF